MDIGPPVSDGAIIAIFLSYMLFAWVIITLRNEGVFSHAVSLLLMAVSINMAQLERHQIPTLSLPVFYTGVKHTISSNKQYLFIMCK